MLVVLNKYYYDNSTILISKEILFSEIFFIRKKKKKLAQIEVSRNHEKFKFIRFIRELFQNGYKSTEKTRTVTSLIIRTLT